MRIDSIKIPAAVAAPVGLQETSLTKLGKVVLIAGRNGAGKSRLLKVVKQQVEQVLDIAGGLPEVEQNIVRFQASIDSWQEEIQHNAHALAVLKTSASSNKETEYRRLKALTSSRERDVKHNEGVIVSLLAQKETLLNCRVTGNGSVLEYVPNQLNLTDSASLNVNDLLQAATQVDTGGMTKLPQGTLAKIQQVQTRWFSATHPGTPVSEVDRQEAVAQYERLQSHVQQFLEAEIGRDLDGRATLFGQPMGQVQFSQGQKVLLQFCVALYAQETALADLILMLDEPENHLHPAALNDVLDKLCAVVTNGQIWIATHLVHVLAHFNNPTIYYLEGGRATFAGNDTLRVLEGLLGDENEREKLTQFLALPFIMSGTRFAYEALLGAAVVMTGAHDRQLQQIKAALEQHRATGAGGGRLKVLDFGAGKGRLVVAMHELATAEGQPLADWLDYVAYDPGPANADECRANIARAYESAGERYFADLNDLRQVHFDGTFDLIILTNVFHEISPDDWPELLRRDVHDLLQPQGQLIIVEDQRLPHGEHAHRFGFLLFDTLEFYKLFGITPADGSARRYYFEAARDKAGRADNRLKAHHFARSLVARATGTTRTEALQELVRNAQKHIDAIRSQAATSQNGRLHVFWLLQFANAELALAKLRG